MSPKKTKTDAQIARDQGISRQAIDERRRAGWTQEEIEAGSHGRPRKSRYDTDISRVLGMSVKEKAEIEGTTPGAIYRQYHANRKKQKVST